MVAGVRNTVPLAALEAIGRPDTADGELSLYRQGEFTDLCRGPHLQDASPIKAVKMNTGA